MLISLETSILLIVAGVILYVIGKYVPIEPIVNRILTILGLILIIVGVVLFVAWLVMFVV
jgi:hypothetical protein